MDHSKTFIAGLPCSTGLYKGPVVHHELGLYPTPNA